MPQMKLGQADVYEVGASAPGQLQTAGVPFEAIAMFVTSLVADLIAERLQPGRTDAPAFQGPSGVELNVDCGPRYQCGCEPEDGCSCDDC